MKSTRNWAQFSKRALAAFIAGLSMFHLVATASALEPSKGVIVLTGFEPFGPNRQANSSWEGIRNLDSSEMGGYKIVCRQLPVVWGAPIEHLRKLIEEHKPIAVFCFGQGRSDGYAIETQASNFRGQMPDNESKMPARPKIVEGAPDEFAATVDFKALAKRLTRDGFKVRLSTSAGRYLCEETLYSLEYLKWKNKTATTVLFAHVPPLGAVVNGEKATPATTERFVKALLTAWQSNLETTSMEQASSVPAGKSKTPAGAEEFVRRYFRVWSNQDMQAYADCFAPNAVVQFLDPDAGVITKSKEPFVAEQAEYHRRSNVRAVEVPLSIEIHRDAQLARATVHWKLTAGSRLEFGYDHFTLRETPTGWQIVNLVFYATEK